MRAALAAGCNFWNAGEFYGTPEYNSLHLLERYFTKYPEDASKVVLSIKGGMDPQNFTPDGSAEGVRRSVNTCVKVLNGKKSIDIFEMARIAKNAPLEETYAELNKCVEEGLIGGISVSEVSVATFQEIIKISKVELWEMEVSLWALDVFEKGIAAACAEHNVILVAYSPIGRGMLTGEIKSPDDIPEADYRRTLPRFQGKAFETNIQLVSELQNFAKQKGCTPAQLAISWVKHQSKSNGNPEIIPIPGASTEARVKENATDVQLTEAELANIQSILNKCEVVGGRYHESHIQYLEV